MGDLAKLIVAKGFKKLPKKRKIAKSGHTGCDPQIFEMLEIIDIRETHRDDKRKLHRDFLISCIKVSLWRFSLPVSLQSLLHIFWNGVNCVRQRGRKKFKYNVGNFGQSRTNGHRWRLRRCERSEKSFFLSWNSVKLTFVSLDTSRIRDCLRVLKEKNWLSKDRLRSANVESSWAYCW